MIEVAEAAAGDADAVDAYLAGRPDALVYSSSRYRELLCRLLDCRDGTLVARDESEIRGVLPLLWLDGAHGRVYNSLPYYGSNGGISADGPAAASALAEAWDARATAAGTLAATIVANPLAESPHPAVAHTLVDDRVGQIGALDHGDPLGRIEASARRNVRKAAASGVRVSRDPAAFARLHAIHEANMRAIGGVPKEPRFFELVPELLEAGEDYDLWVADIGGEVVAALLVLLFNATIEYFTPAVEQAARPLQPLAAILAAAMAHYGERGFTRWNWGGTWRTQESLLRFKRKWGAESRPYSYFVQLNDDSLLALPASAILAGYKGFYVVPFAALHERGGRS